MIQAKPIQKQRHLGKIWARLARIISIRDVGIFASALLLSRVFLLGELAPFGTAFVAAAWFTGISPFYALAGCLLGTITLLPAAPYAAMVSSGLVTLVAFLLTFAKRRLKKWFMILIVCLCTMAPMLFFRQPNIYETVMGALELLICAVMFVVFSTALNYLQRYKSNTILSEEQMLCMALGLCVMALGTGEVMIWQFNLSNIFAILLVLCFASICGAGLGAAAGATMGFALTLTGSREALFVGAMAVCAMMAGVFRPFKKIGILIAFELTNFLLSMHMKGFATPVIPHLDVAAAALIFLFFPRKWLTALGSMMDGAMRRAFEQRHFMNRLKDTVATKISQVSMIFRQMAYAFGTKSPMEKVDDDRMSILETTAHRQCMKCGLVGKCWNIDAEKGKEAADRLMERYQKRGILFESDCPEFLSDCISKRALSAAFNASLAEYEMEGKERNRLEECRQLVGQQLYGVSGVLVELSKKFDAEMKLKDEMEKELRESLEQQGIKLREAFVMQSASGKLETHLVAKPCGGKGACRDTMERAVSLATGKRMKLVTGGCTAKAKRCTLAFEEARALEIEVGVATRPAESGMVCGDSYRAASCGEGKYLICLGDGMGNGQKAKEASEATVSLIESFCKAGFDMDTAFKAINQLLIFRGKDEVYSTVDLCMVDLVDSLCHFTKIGAAPSYIIEKDKVEAATSETLPLGIVDHVEPVDIEKTLHAGDSILMVSDGVHDRLPQENTCDWLAKAMDGGKNAREKAQKILTQALNIPGKETDDMTVIVARLHHTN